MKIEATIRAALPFPVKRFRDRLIEMYGNEHVFMDIIQSEQGRTLKVRNTSNNVITIGEKGFFSFDGRRSVYFPEGKHHNGAREGSRGDNSVPALFGLIARHVGNGIEGYHALDECRLGYSGNGYTLGELPGVLFGVFCSETTFRELHSWEPENQPFEEVDIQSPEGFAKALMRCYPSQELTEWLEANPNEWEVLKRIFSESNKKKFEKTFNTKA